MSFNLSQEELAKWEAVFKELDKNGDGRVTAKEILEIRRNTQLNVDLMMAMADANGDGKINLQEYLLIAQINLNDDDEIGKIMFNFYDSDRDGLINLQDFLKMLRIVRVGKISEEDALKKISMLSPKIQGKIDYEEYVKVISKIHD